MRRRGRPKGSLSDRKSYGPLADLLRHHRTLKRMGLAEVAAACKCSVQFISNIEHGRAPLPWDKAEQIARVLGIQLEDLRAANLASRSDFRVFATSTKLDRQDVDSDDETTRGRQIAGTNHSSLVSRGRSSNGKIAEAKEAENVAAFFTLAAQLTAQDQELRGILIKYRSASAQTRKKFIQSAKKLLLS